jgi:DMSO/TMAO reductase YedYZ molybdopterin-dependent catalytic subunit
LVAGHDGKPAYLLLRITDVNSRHKTARRRPGWLSSAVIGRGALAGLLTGALALTVGFLVGSLVGPDSSPFVAVGELSIDHTPPPVKNFAIREFGADDKLVLELGILVVVGLLAIVIGIIAMRRLSLGMAGLGLFTAIGVIAAATRPTANAGYVLPSLAGGVAGAFALYRFWVATHEPAGALAPQARPAADWRPPGLEPPDSADSADLDSADLDSADLDSADLDSADSGDRLPALQPWQQPQARRTFLTTTAVVAGSSLVAGLGGRLLSERASVSAAQQNFKVPRPAIAAPKLPSGVNLDIPGLSSFITPDSSFYRVDTALVLPEVAPSTWQLRIHGMVSRELTLNFHDLLNQELIEDYITLCCVSNPVGGPYIGNAKWLGASVRTLLRKAGIRAGADQLLCTSADGFTSGTPVQTAMDGRDSMLAVAMNGQALPVAHGFPVRMVVPGLYGYVSACKWITDIEVTTYAANVSYWAQRGWSAQAPIKTESRIDVPTGLNPLKPGRNAVAGVAWAQHKGIEAVEVRIDRGPWNLATLAAVPDLDTWRQWVWYWDATPGTHVIEARATDKTGYTQTSLIEPPEPNGASGYPSVELQVRH